MKADGIPEWLRCVLEDNAPAPKIYRWRIEDVLKEDNSGSLAPPVDHGIATPAQPEQPSDDDARRRIYILGLGNLGRLFASSLAKLPHRPPITLVVHKKSLLAYWHAKPGVIMHPAQSHDGDFDVEKDTTLGFDIEMWSEDPPPGFQPALEIPSTIQNLIIATKAQVALPQADWLRRYLGPQSTVVFAQNGMNKLWPPYGPMYNEARYRPHPQLKNTFQNPRWFACIVRHGVVSLGPFESVHASPADVVLGRVDTNETAGDQSNKADSDCYLVKQLSASPQLNASYAERKELWFQQLEKLVANSIINPLTAVLRCKNGDIFTRGGGPGDLSGVVDRLLQEASNVMQCLMQYDQSSRELLQGTPGLTSNLDKALLDRLSTETLRKRFYKYGELVTENISSMLQDMRAGKATEIREFNGWIVETAKYLQTLDGMEGRAVDVSTHRALIDLVESCAHLTPEQLVQQLGTV